MKYIRVNIEDDIYAEMMKAGINPHELFHYAASYMLSNKKGTNWYYATRMPILKDKISILKKDIIRMERDLKDTRIELLNYEQQIEILEENFKRDRRSTRLCNLIELLNDKILKVEFDESRVIQTEHDLINQIMELDNTFDITFHIKLLKDLQ